MVPPLKVVFCPGFRGFRGSSPLISEFPKKKIGNTFKKELLVSACPVALCNFIDVQEKSFKQILQKVLNYLVTNTQYHLSKLEIELETSNNTNATNTI